MHRIVLFVALLALAGCRGEPKPPPMAGTPESTRAALVSALDGWKQGKTAADFAGQSPPFYVTDDDFNRGTRLVDYQIEGEPQPRGTGYSFTVTLTTQDKTGAKAPSKKKVAYTAYTEPNLAVIREDRQP